MAKDEYLLVMCAFPSAEEARQIGTQLLQLQVAACVNLIPQVESVFRWKGEIQSESEVLALIKTTRDNYQEIEARIQELHPYDIPAVISVPVEKGASAYLNWVSEVTRD